MTEAQPDPEATALASGSPRRRLRPLHLVAALVAVVLLGSIAIRVIAGVRGPDQVTGENDRYCEMVQGMTDLSPLTAAVDAPLRDLIATKPEDPRSMASLFYMLDPNDAPPRIRQDAEILSAHFRRAHGGQESTEAQERAARSAAVALDRYAQTCTPKATG